MDVTRRDFVKSAAAVGAGVMMADRALGQQAGGEDSVVNVALLGAGTQGRVLMNDCLKIPGIRFHVAGRNAPVIIEKMLEKEEIAYHGEVADARAFMQSYRIMVAPLLTGSGIRIKILEAMALGRPVVTTPIGIEGIAAENNRDIMVADTPDLFKDHIVNLIKNDHIAHKLAAGGRKLIQENFDTFELSTRLDRFFKEQV